MAQENTIRMICDRCGEKEVLIAYQDKRYLWGQIRVDVREGDYRIGDHDTDLFVDFKDLCPGCVKQVYDWFTRTRKVESKT